MSVGNRLTAKIKWTVQVYLHQLQATVVRPMTEVPPVVYCATVRAHYARQQHQPQSIICCVHWFWSIWKVNLSRPSILQRCYLHCSANYAQCGLVSLHRHFFFSALWVLSQPSELGLSSSGGAALWKWAYADSASGFEVSIQVMHRCSPMICISKLLLRIQTCQPSSICLWQGHHLQTCR